MKTTFIPVPSYAFCANSINAFVPEYWANESVAILEENMVIANLVHRDFEDELAEAGEIVNTRKPGEFTMKRKAMTSDITVQNATATNIPVKLDQHMHVAFLIKDREQSKSFKDLTATYLRPALLAIAQGIDKMLLAQAPRFLRTDRYIAGSLGTNASVASVLDTRKKLNDDKAPVSGRNMIVSSKDETALLNLEIFISAEKVGDAGTALREASLGRRLGFDFYMCQNVCSVTGTSDTVTGAVNNSGGYPAGTTTMTVNGLTAAIANGTWFTVAGDMTPQRVTSTTGGSTPTVIVCSPGLKTAVVHTAVITIYDPGTVNNSPSGYAAGYEEYITVADFTAMPQVGQFVQFAANGAMYAVVEVSGSTILLDRSLDVTVAHGASVFIGPNGTYNFAFTRNALALVTRPMALPMSGAGATGAIANYNGLSVRVVFMYDKDKQGLNCTVDILCGTAILDLALGEVMLG